VNDERTLERYDPLFVVLRSCCRASLNNSNDIAAVNAGHLPWASERPNIYQGHRGEKETDFWSNTCNVSKTPAMAVSWVLFIRSLSESSSCLTALRFIFSEISFRRRPTPSRRTSGDFVSESYQHRRHGSF
jgi:hypothetical protein